MHNFYLTKLIKLYFNLPKGCIIDNPNLLNFVCKIFDICDVYVSNKALKHIVESRRDKDFMDVDEIIDLVKGFITTLLDPDVVFINKENSIGVCKDIHLNESHSTLIILESVTESCHYEIVTVYEKNKKQILKLKNIKHLIK